LVEKALLERFSTLNAGFSGCATRFCTTLKSVSVARVKTTAGADGWLVMDKGCVVDRAWGWFERAAPPP